MERTLNKEKEEVIIASILYLSCAVPIFGLIFPLIMWILNKGKSVFLSFHSLQCLIYQAIGVIGFIIGMALYILSFFLVFIVMIGSTATSGGEEPSPIIFIFFLIPFFIFFLIMLFFLLYVIYAIIGCASIIIKRDFKYIILGKLLESYLLEDSNNSKPMNES